MAEAANQFCQGNPAQEVSGLSAFERFLPGFKLTMVPCLDSSTLTPTCWIKPLRDSARKTVATRGESQNQAAGDGQASPAAHPHRRYATIGP